MSGRVPKNFCMIVLALAMAIVGAAQTSKKRPAKSTATKSAAAQPSPSPAPEDVPPLPGPKRNERPAEKPTLPVVTEQPGRSPAYFYEFSRPGFVYSRIRIEHDDAGKGTIAFEKDGFAEPVTDPIQLSEVTLARLRTTFAALNFLDSTENYQTQRDYSHLGQTTLRLKRDGRERTVTYNWTDNKDARFLMDEYRRIGVEYTWRFEIMLARDNQPLFTPGLVDALDSYLRRGEISDPPHLLPFLGRLATDERLPLMARNRLLKLIAEIEKSARKTIN
jgi:hypothetical protein